MNTISESISDVQNEISFCTFQDVIFYYLCQIILIFSEFSFFNLLFVESSTWTTATSVCTKDHIEECFDKLNSLWIYDEFQVVLFQIFAFIFIFNVILIFFAWNYYADRIYERFMKPTSQEIIEDLCKSVARLKLPKDYSPRL